MTSYLVEQFDGGFIHIRGDRNVIIDWYCKHMGVEVAWNWREMVILNFPSGNSFTLKIENPERPTTIGIRLKFSFDTPDIERTYSELSQSGVEVSDLYIGPGGRSFDFKDPCGTTHTAVQARKELLDHYPSHHRFIWMHLQIGVSNLKRSVDWYSRYLRMVPQPTESHASHILLHNGSRHVNNGPVLTPLPVYLVQTEANTQPSHKMNETVLPMFMTDSEPSLRSAHKHFRANGIEASDIFGEIRSDSGMADFTFHDPDGNRLMLYYYVRGGKM